MTTRPAKRPLTGRPCRSVETVLGHRRYGDPGATLYFAGYGYVPLDDSLVVRALMADLGEVLAHLEGPKREAVCNCPEDPAQRAATYTVARMDLEPHSVACPRWGTTATPTAGS